MEALVHEIFDGMPLALRALVLLVENLVIFAGALAAGAWLVKRYAHRRVVPAPPPLRREEVVYAAITVLLNTAVTLVGLELWERGHIRFRDDMGAGAIFDVIVLFLVMDAAMYALHRVAHFPPLYALIHRPHHRYEHPRPLTLFVLSPQETIAFGGLWLAVILAYDASWLGMSVYLALNAVFGTLGHLGVEPFPDAWARIPVVRHLATSSFHAQHHVSPGTNYGFYTTVWDRLFGTLATGGRLRV